MQGYFTYDDPPTWHHMAAVVRMAFAQLHWCINYGPMWAGKLWSLPSWTTASTLYKVLPLKTTLQIKWVQNAAACFLFGTSGQEDKKSMMQALHWLPTGFQVQFEINGFDQ